MALQLPDDPYLALGVPKDATAAAIKSAYRKLVLKFHPDKVTDDSLKQTAADQFHKVQTAWETIGDEDKRCRYDAQTKLAALRKEAMERHVAGDPGRLEVRTAAYHMPTDSRPNAATFTARGPERVDKFHVEERRPYEPDYFDRPRTTDRSEREYDYEPPRRTPPKDDRSRVRVTRQDSKDAERARHRERGRQATKATARDRDHKYAYAHHEPLSDSDSDSPDERSTRRMREEELRRVKEKYHEQSRTQREEAATGHYNDDRTRKMFAAQTDAKDYIERTRANRPHAAPERRPSPSRLASKDRIDYVKRGGDGRPAAVRRSSARTRTASRDEAESPRRARRDVDRERQSSIEYEDLPRRPASLSQTKSDPEAIRFPAEKQRSYSIQIDSDRSDAFRPSPIRRAETMPMQPTRREEPRKAPKPSTLRQSEISADFSPPPPPRSAAEPKASSPNKYHYGKEYADDTEYPTPNGYRTEVREPHASSRKAAARSPSPPPREHDRSERARPASSRYPSAQSPQIPPPNLRTTSTSYMYTPQGVEAVSPLRPGMSRTESSRSVKPDYLFGEIPTTTRSSPRQAAAASSFSPPPDSVKYREIRPEDAKFQTGYSSSRRTSDARSPSYYRSNNFSSPPVSA